MPSLRQYRDRIVSVKNTRKITSAMKMVAASKLKRAQEYAEASQPYARAMSDMIANVAGSLPSDAKISPLLTGTGRDQTHLLVVMSSDRGLCGGFNANLLRAVRAEVRKLESNGKTVKILCIGRKARDILKRDQGSKIMDAITGLGGKARLTFADAQRISTVILNDFARGGFDICTLMFNEFKSVLTQTPTPQQLIPFRAPNSNDNKATGRSPYNYEPSEEQILADLLPRNLSVQIFRALLDSAAGEQAARMTAMDNSTRNAGDMIKRLSIAYNRARQAYITKELIEIISGAEAV
jgi:F-type H+-transporting ATPase subunit gamma